MIIYVVRPGDNLYTIARRYGVPVERIASDNDIDNPSAIVVGQALVIQGDFQDYVVRPGDTLSGIAARFGVTVPEILRYNRRLISPAAIYPGMVIVVPAAAPPLGTIEVNGYTFPGGRLNLVRAALPYLTYLSIFSYEVNADGSLPTVDDTRLIELARSQRVAPIMVITNMEPEKGFSSELASTILNSSAIQETLINNIIATLRAKNYAGLNIDFEYVFPQDREKYNAFLRRVTDRLRPLGYLVTTSLAPKASATQRGLLYEAHDYPFHGRTADRVILMTYEWGYTYGPPMAVAPLPAVRGVIDYAVTAIPPAKILMGVPNYGYDWPLPYVPGETSARAIGNSAAVQIAVDNHVAISFDRQAASPFFNYVDKDRVRHQVWFEDARSIRMKLALVQRYGLAGVSYWTLGNRFTQNWVLLGSLFQIKKIL